MRRILLSFPRLPNAETIIFSARLYSLALQQLEQNVDIAYQLLIAAVEAVANEALQSFSPTEEDMIETKRSVVGLALRFGVTENGAQKLAVEACSGISWASRKFTKFILDNTCDRIWQEDDLFKLPLTLVPGKQEYEEAIKKIYSARGKLTHSGRFFPPSSSIGVGGTIPARALFSYNWSSKPFPPIVWFERVVNNALNFFIERSSESGIGENAPSESPTAA